MKKNLHVSHIMHANPVTVHIGEKPSAAQQKMMDGGFHHLPVVSGKKLVGMLSTTDLLRASYEYGIDTRQSTVVLDDTRSIEDLMQPNPLAISVEATVRKATEILAEGMFHGLPVVKDDELVGIVTTTDLLRFYLEHY